VDPGTTPGNQNAVRVITQPGSYYLTGNITVPAGKSGVVFAARNVTLDLNGFTITGQPGSIDGVRVILTASGELNTFEANIITHAGIGIAIEGPNNLIVRNSFRSCGTPFIIATRNVYGPFIMVQNGADRGAVPASTHPAANIVQ
jgi:hypothetical protein